MPHVHLLFASGTAQRRLLDAKTAELRKKGYDDIRRQEGGDWHTLLTEHQGGGLFGEKSAVVVEEAEKLGTIPPALVSLLGPPDAETVLLLVCKTETSSPVPKANFSQCSVSKAAEPSPWSKDRDEIVRNVAKRHGVSIGYEGVSLLKELFEDTGELAAEAEKLAECCRLKKEITLPDIETYCLSDGSKSLLKLLDALCAGRQIEAIRSLDMLVKNAELLPTLSAVHNRLRLAFYAARCPREKNAFARAFGAKDYAIRQADQAAKIYGHEKLGKCLMGIVRINANEKSGLGASWRDLTVLLLELISLDQIR